MDIIPTILGTFRIDQWAVAYLVLMAPIVVSIIAGLRVHRELLSVSVRATLQLIFIAVVLVPVFVSHWTIQIALVLAMIAAGGFVATERGRDLPGSLPISISALLLGVVPILTIFIVTGALDFIPNVIIPIGGMLIGNATRTVSLLFHKTRVDFETNQEIVEAMMLDGADYFQAMEYPMQETLKNALVPRIDSLKTLGIVHIPGAMAGMMIAGANPLEAAGYQLLIFFGIVATAALSAMSGNRWMYRRLYFSIYPHLANAGFS